MDILKEVPGTSNRLSWESATPASMSYILSTPPTCIIEVDGVCFVLCVLVCLFVEGKTFSAVFIDQLDQRFQI